MQTTSSAFRFVSKLGVSLLGIALAALLAACSTLATAISSGLGQPTATSTPDPPPFWCDSVWVIDASAWIDSEGDGQQGADESPLAGVRFDADDGHKGVSDEAGQYTFHILTGCNSLPTYTVTATPPPGYHLTTPNQIKVEGKGTAAFGFAPD